MERLRDIKKSWSFTRYFGFYQTSRNFVGKAILVFIFASNCFAQLTPEDINLDFDESGKATTSVTGTSMSTGEIDDRIQNTLNFPDVKMSYAFDLDRQKFRQLLGFEIFDDNRIVSNFNLGTQYAGFDIGYKFLDVADVALVVGHGYDFSIHDDTTTLALQSKLSILQLSRLKVFTGIDFVQERLRQGIGVNVHKKGAWVTDVVFDTSPFIGFSHGYNFVIQGDVNLGGFIGYDFHREGVGTGLSLNIRF